MRAIVVAGLLLGSLLTISGIAEAQLQVTNAWARPALQGQTAAGAFMSLVSNEDARVVGVSSPVAGVVEIHEMVMEGSVMKMRAVPALELPAGRRVELKPGGYHVMLLDLKRPLKAGERIPLELRLETRDKRLVTQSIEVEVALKPPSSDGAAAHKH